MSATVYPYLLTPRKEFEEISYTPENFENNLILFAKLLKGAGQGARNGNKN